MQSKQKLGRGLSALIGDMESFDTLTSQTQHLVDADSEGDQQGRMTNVAIKKLKPGPWQPRQNFNDTEIEKLSISIKENGLLQPILISPNEEDDTYLIIAGERRWRAALRAKLEVLPCIIKKVSDEQAQFIALIENIQREELSAIEEAEGYQKIIDQFGHTQEKIAEVVGKSRSHVANTLRLLSLPKSIRSILQNQEITAGHARCLIGLDERKALLLIDDIIQKKLNVRQLEKVIQKMATQTVQTHEPLALKQQILREKGDLEKICEDIGRVLEAKITLKESAGKGTLAIEFSTLDQLDKILEKLSS